MTVASDLSTSLQSLMDVGFKRVGEWKLNRVQADPTIIFELIEEDADAPNVLYAFVAGGEILYI
jgi:hypothetical protein